MATILQTGENSFIVGDPPEALGPREHWCPSCLGDGLEYDWDDELKVCMGCYGACVVQCFDPKCEDQTEWEPSVSPSELLEQRLRDWAGFKHAAVRHADVRAVLDELYELRATDHTNGSGS